MILAPPIVVNLRSGASYDVYIGLGSPWGNPYANTTTRGSAIRMYENRMRRFLKEDAGWRVDLKALAGKRLGCHCSPQPCHGDVLVKLFLELYGDPGKIESGEPCVGKDSSTAGSLGHLGPSQ